LDLRLPYFVGTMRFSSSSKWTTTICGGVTMARDPSGSLPT